MHIYSIILYVYMCKGFVVACILCACVSKTSVGYCTQDIAGMYLTGTISVVVYTAAGSQ